MVRRFEQKQKEVADFWKDKDPCWKLMDCPEYVYKKCAAYFNPERPCWEVAYAQSEILTGIPKDCKSCRVYHLYNKSSDGLTAKV